MYLFQKTQITDFESSRVQMQGDYIIVALGPYSNYKKRNRDYLQIINNWRDHNGKERLPTLWSFIAKCIKRRIFRCTFYQIKTMMKLSGLAIRCGVSVDGKMLTTSSSAVGQSRIVLCFAGRYIALRRHAKRSNANITKMILFAKGAPDAGQTSTGPKNNHATDKHLSRRQNTRFPSVVPVEAC